MSTFYDAESGTYKNFENEVIAILEEIATASAIHAETEETDDEADE